MGATTEWPTKFCAYVDLVVPVEAVSYGHLGSDRIWEEYFDTAVLKEHWTLTPNWSSQYWHPCLKLLLRVKVDDLNRSGPSGSLAKGWTSIAKHIKLGKVGPVGKYLGCDHARQTSTIDGQPIRAIEYGQPIRYRRATYPGHEVTCGCLRGCS